MHGSLQEPDRLIGSAQLSFDPATYCFCTCKKEYPYKEKFVVPCRLEFDFFFLQLGGSCRSHMDLQLRHRASVLYSIVL